MATATAAARNAPKDAIFEWEGKDKNGKVVRGEMRAGGTSMVQASLRRQGILVQKVKKRRMSGGGSIKPKDISVFTRQLATMMKAGVPLLQSFDIVARGSTNPRVTKLLNDIRSDVETGTSLSSAFRKHPLYFDALYAAAREAGEAGGILEALLDRLALYQEKTMAIKSKIKSALMYPIAVIVVAFVVLTVIMLFVIPAFKEVFSSFGADLPAPTLFVIAMSEFFVNWWYVIFGVLFGGGYFFLQSWKRSEKMQMFMDRLLLKVPVFGDLINKSVLARWTRTLSTMFAAGVPLVEALTSVAGATGNIVYENAVLRMRDEVATGQRLQRAMENTNLFPNMVNQMIAVGEESGSLDQMAAKVADFYELEVDAAVDSMSSLLEPLIMAILGVLVGGLVIAMYLPIFKLGAVV
jgi:type IV pilus assembly protein PilC